MTVKEIIEKTATLLNKGDVVKYLKTGATENYSRVLEDVEILVGCYNVIQEEIASSYYKFKKVEKFSPENGVIKLDRFSSNPFAIIAIKDEKGCKLDAKILPTEIKVNKTAVIEYYYIPNYKNLEDICNFTGTSVSARTLCYGIMTEYLLIKGSFEEAGTWHSKYVDAINLLALNGKRLKVKGRVWQ